MVHLVEHASDLALNSDLLAGGPSVALSEARYHNLVLITSRRGSKTELAKQCDLNPSVISHILKRRYGMTDDIASRIEAGLELPEAYLSQVRRRADFPEALRERFIADTPVAKSANSSRRKPGKTASTPSPTEFFKMSSVNLAQALGSQMNVVQNPLANLDFDALGPLAQALLAMLADKARHDDLSEDTAFRLINLLMAPSPNRHS